MNNYLRNIDYTAVYRQARLEKPPRTELKLFTKSEWDSPGMLDELISKLEKQITRVAGRPKAKQSLMNLDNRLKLHLSKSVPGSKSTKQRRLSSKPHLVPKAKPNMLIRKEINQWIGTNKQPKVIELDSASDVEMENAHSSPIKSKSKLTTVSIHFCAL